MSISQPTTRIAHSCSIYLPNQNDNLSMAYNTQETGMVGYGLATAWKMGKAWSDKDWKQVAEVVLGGLGAAGVDNYQDGNEVRPLALESNKAIFNRNKKSLQKLRNKKKILKEEEENGLLSEKNIISE